MNSIFFSRTAALAVIFSPLLEAENIRIKNPEKFDKPSITWGESTQDPTSSNKGGPATVKLAYTVKSGEYWPSYFNDEQKPNSTTVTASASPASKLSQRDRSVGDTHSHDGPESFDFSVALTYTDPTENGGGAQATKTETKKVDIQFVGRGGGNRDHRGDGSVIDVAGNAPNGTGGGTGGDGGGYHDCEIPFIPGTLTPNEIVDARTPLALVPPTSLELVSENITASGYKYGYDTYIVTTPPKRFSRKMVSTLLVGGDQETPVRGTFTEICNPPDGQEVRIIQAGNPSYYGTPAGGARTEVTLSHTFPVDHYDDCPNNRDDTPAVMEVRENITVEYTTAALKASVFDKAFDLKGEGYYLHETALAKLDVSKDELNVDYQKTKYKWRIPADTTAYPRPYKVTWFEVFTPEDTIPDDGVEPAKEYTTFTEEIPAGKSETAEHEIDPASVTPPKEGTWEVSLLPVDSAVDADRDGEITFDGKDKTTVEKPFRFWINDDDDTFGEGNDTGGTLDRIPAVTPDHQNSFIDFIRDLEDFSRISFKLPDSFWSQIKAGEVQVGFKWSDTSDGNPAVNIFRQANQSGGQVQYFVDESEALDQAGTFTNAAQKVMTVSGSGTAYFPQSFIDRLPTTSAPTYVLFEGAAKGKGKLNLVLKVNGQEVVCDGPWIKLMDVRQFYTRGRTDYTANVISDPWDNPNPHVIASVPDNTPEFVVDPDETQQCIIHVHGWRMTEGDSRNWSEMTFKRLWQLHYKGRFATFRWATFSDDTHPNTSLLTYNRSEYRSWLCGPALAQFVNGLPYPGSRYLVAHSMGNVISGKALQAGMNVNRYVMCNAAMAAMSYDPSITNLPLSASSTPDTDSDPATAAFGLKNRFNDNLTTRINYYLPDDDALQSWIANQIVNKPELFLTSAYVYDPFDTPGNKIYYSDGVVLPSRRNVASLAEAMGHAVKSRSNAVGAVGYANGCISSKVGMDGFGFGDEHSAEWNWSLTGSYKFWRKLFVSFQIPTTAPQ